MKRIFNSLCILMACTCLFQACDDTETYAEMKEKEREAIEAYIKSEGIKVISYEQFCAQDSTTDVKKKEYVLFKDKGVYMQIVRKGEGEPLANGERAEINVRYYEVNIKEMDTLTGNLYDASNHDVMTIENKNGFKDHFGTAALSSGSAEVHLFCAVLWFSCGTESGQCQPLPHSV